MRIDTLSVLQMSYMPFLNNGGLFIFVAQPHVAAAGSKGIVNFKKPKPPNFNKIAAKKTEPKVEAST